MTYTKPRNESILRVCKNSPTRDRFGMKRLPKPKLIVLAGIIVLTLGCASLSQQAVAEPKPTSPEQLAIAQIPLTDLNEKIEQAVSVEPALRDTSYAGASIDAATMTYAIYWKGTIPSVVSTILASAPSNVNVQVRIAKFSYGQLDAAMTDLMNQHPGVVLDTSFAPDRDGIIAGVELQEARLPSLPAAINGVPVTMRESSPAIPASRPDDVGAWHAGAQQGRSSGSFCTTGWPLKKYNPPVYYLITANHCFEANGVNVYDGGIDLIGSTRESKSATDIAVIRQNSAVVSKYMLDGLVWKFFSRVDRGKDDLCGGALRLHLRLIHRNEL